MCASFYMNVQTPWRGCGCTRQINMVRNSPKGRAVANELKPQFTADYQAVRRDFDLSRNSSLRMLETTAVSIADAGDAASGFLKAVLSTVTSPLPLVLLVGYGAYEVRCHTPSYVRDCALSPSKRAAEDLVHLRRFKLFSEMFMVREFRLVLCTDVLGCAAAEDAKRALERIVKAERMNGGFDYLPCEPVIISEMRYPRTRRTDTQVGAGDGRTLVTCAL